MKGNTSKRGAKKKRHVIVILNLINVPTRIAFENKENKTLMRLDI